MGGRAKRRCQSEGDVFSSNCGAAWSFVTRRRGGVFLEASIYICFLFFYLISKPLTFFSYIARSPLTTSLSFVLSVCWQACGGGFFYFCVFFFVTRVFFFSSLVVIINQGKWVSRAEILHLFQCALVPVPVCVVMCVLREWGYFFMYTCDVLSFFTNFMRFELMGE